MMTTGGNNTAIGADALQMRDDLLRQSHSHRRRHSRLMLRAAAWLWRHA